MNTLLRRCCLHARPLLGRQPHHRAIAAALRPTRLQPAGQPWRQLSTASSAAPDQGAVSTQATADQDIDASQDPAKRLPWSCPGCGAYSQTQDNQAAGYFSTTRKSVRSFIHVAASPQDQTAEKEIPAADADEAPSQDADSETSLVPVCDRCHDLLHHNRGQSVEHPPLEAIQAMFDETPHSYNHVYHVLDAADFPLSLIPRLHEKLDLSPQRAQNRRAKHAKYLRGRVAEMSFVITRADLLAPRKEQVDALMPALVAVLRKALGRAGRDVRLGNVRCVSANRGWWTADLKEAIWKRGGGGWMVGKVNVGKSKLFENILPKGRAQVDSQPEPEEEETLGYDRIRAGSQDAGSGLLPPRPADTDYPVLPVVSHVSGTTAGPIRVPFGAGRGELIDLPGLSRGGLEELVKDEHKEDLIMRSRITADQVTVKPHQSLLISDLIRITPRTDAIFLASPFVSLGHHITNTEKAAEVLAQKHPDLVAGVAKPEAAETFASAGTFRLKTDVTRQRAGPLTAKDAAGLDPARLPFVIYATDILIEGVGWVEVACQVRRRHLEEVMARPDYVEGDEFPAVEVFSPNGLHVGQRQTLNAWLTGGKRQLPASRRKTRPRRSVKGQKKAMKRDRREAQGQ